MSKPYVPQPSRSRFYVPPTLAADFTNFLNNDIPNTVMNFEHQPNWYDRNADGYKASYIRGEIYPDSTKSRYTNTDHNLNLRFDVNSGVRKGDMVVDENGSIYLLDWDVTLESNNAPTRGLKCNATIEVKRWFPEETTIDGYLLKEAEYRTIVAPIPVNAYRYEGRPEYSAVENQPGISPNALRLLSIQYNEMTKHLMVGDVFNLGPERYIVIDIDRVGLNVTEEFGTLLIQARKEPGGSTKV